MTEGRFYFISDAFYTLYDPQKKLMQNKEKVDGLLHNRPCFFAFCDKKTPDILWCIPISSKVEKYESLYKEKVNKMKTQKQNPAECDTIRFGEVLGQKRAFLIQNMFPVTKKYISSTYIDKNTNNEVTISQDNEKDIIKRAQKVLKASVRNPFILFADVKSIKNMLIAELEKENLEKSRTRSSLMR